MVCRIQKIHSIFKGHKIQVNYINSHHKNNILGKTRFDMHNASKGQHNEEKKKKKTHTHTQVNLYCLPED